jgi:hypothetical protein
MKKIVCDECLILPTCSKSCIKFAHQANALRHEIMKLEKKLLSKSGKKRKRLKLYQVDHYNALVKKWNRSCILRDSIWERNFKKLGISYTDRFDVLDYIQSLSIDKYFGEFLGGGESHENYLQLAVDHNIHSYLMKFGKKNIIFRSRSF